MSIDGSAHLDGGASCVPPGCVGPDCAPLAASPAAVDPDEFRKGLFALRTRRFGTVAEMMIEKMIGAAGPLNRFHDLYDDAQRHRVEVKFSTVNRKHADSICWDNLLASVAASGADRAVPFAEWQDHPFDCNIQQVKTSEFDVLYYGLFFRDEIVIFRIASEMIAEDQGIRFSDKQHKGNVGEGQFHLSNATLPHHLQHHLYARLSYAEFIELLSAEAGPTA